MELVTLKIVIGFVVGTLIGLTGLGGGVLLLPILIFGLCVPAIVAVGSDALFNFLTKIPSSVVHLSKGTVRGKVVVALAAGSVPGSILGVRFLQHLRMVVLTGVTSLLHWRLGYVDASLVGWLLIGSILGGLIGSYLSTRVPVLWLRRILCVVLMTTGGRMLWA